MYRHLFYIIIFITNSCTLFAQKQIKGTVVNVNGSAIPFATVSTLNGLGTVCDSAGNFVLKLSKADIAPSLLIHSAGYVTDTLLLTDSLINISVELTARFVALSEITIVAKQSIESKSSVSAFTTNKKEMAQLNPQNIAEVLQTKVGFTNKSDYQAPLTLRGMSGKRILVLRNGNRRFSSYPAGVMSHTINVYDLDRIEVEKGAASVIYGSGAMAGIINLIDKSPFKQKGFNGKLTGGYGSVNQEKSILACGGWSNGKFALKAGFRFRDAENFSYPDGSIAENSFYTDKDIFVTTGYNFSEIQSLVFTADIHNGGPWGKPVGFNGSDFMRVQTHEDKSNNYSLKYTRKTMGVFQNIELNAFLSNESRLLVKNFYTAAGYMLSYVETTYFSDYYYGSLVKSEINVAKNYKITAGVEGYCFHISTPTDAVDYIDTISFENRISHNARSNTAGVFMQNQIRINQGMNAMIGIRYNYASVFEGDVHSAEQLEERNETKHAVSGNIATTLTLSENSELKINVARSFRMPETTEMYADNYGSNGILYGNPNLKPEYCCSVDACYLFKSKIVDFELSPFFWLMEDMISKEEIGGMPGTKYTYVNIGKVRLVGGEATSKIKVDKLFSKNDKLVFRVGVAYLNGTDITETNNTFSKGEPLDYVPPFNMKADVSYTCIFSKEIKLDLGFRSIYYSEQKRLGESSYATPQYFALACNLGVSLPKVKTKPTLNLTISNLLNNEYYGYQSYLITEERDIRLFVTFNF